MDFQGQSFGVEADSSHGLAADETLSRDGANNCNDSQINEETSEERAFAEVWSELTEILGKGEIKSSGKKTSKKEVKKTVEKIINGLKLHGKITGFTDKQLESIWQMATHSSLNLNCTERRKLLFLMLPKNRVGDKVIMDIVYWLKDARSSGFKPTDIRSVYQLLIMYQRYKLTDDDAIMNKGVVDQILLTETENYGIPWKMLLFRSIITPNTLSPSHVRGLIKLLGRNDLKKTQTDDVYASLGVCRYMRPELFIDKPEVCWKIRTLNFPKNESMSFHQCSVRLQAATAGALHPMADKIFSEFLPKVVRTGSFVKKNILETMLKHLETDLGVAEIALKPVLLQAFQEWIKPMLRHRFHHFSGSFDNEDYSEKYKFMMEKCTRITKISQNAVPVVSEWLSRFYMGGAWDFQTLKCYIDELVPYLKWVDFMPHKRLIRKQFLTSFLHRGWLRFTMWQNMEDLFFNWITKDEDPYLEGLQWLLDLMKQCIASLLFTLPFGHSDASSKNMITHVCQFYYRLHLMKSPKIEGILERSLLSFDDSLVAVITVTKNVDGLKYYSKAILIRGKRLASTTDQEKNPKIPIDDGSMTLLSCISNKFTDGNLIDADIARKADEGLSEFKQETSNLLIPEWLENLEMS